MLDLYPPEITEAVREYAATVFRPGVALLDVIVELTTRIHTDFTYRSGSTAISTRVDTVMSRREGVCQDFARVAIACLRSQGLAARYVSGYLATEPPPGRERVIGADASHAWAAVWLPGGRWLPFDPTNDKLVDERHVTLAGDVTMMMYRRYVESSTPNRPRARSPSPSTWRRRNCRPCRKKCRSRRTSPHRAGGRRSSS